MEEISTQKGINGVLPWNFIPWPWINEEHLLLCLLATEETRFSFLSFVESLFFSRKDLHNSFQICSLAYLEVGHRIPP